eukprot:COSAG02_NODE_1302_length_13358_cov_12.308243_4_plen_146_part_00
MSESIDRGPLQSETAHLGQRGAQIAPGGRLISNIDRCSVASGGGGLWWGERGEDRVGAKEGVGLFLLVLGRSDAVAPHAATACTLPPTPCFSPPLRYLQLGVFRRIERTGYVAAGEVTSGVYFVFVRDGVATAGRGGRVGAEAAR